MRSRLTFWLLLIVLIGVGGIVLSKTSWMASLEGWTMSGLKPVQETTSRLTSPVRNFLESLTRRGDLEAENERLQQEIERLGEEIVRLRELEIENERLRVLLDYKAENQDYQFLSAAIIGHDPSNLTQYIIIDKGTHDGVEEGMAVVASGGLAGRVKQSFDTSARVLLLTDPSSSVNAMIQRSRSLGVVSGKPGNGLIMQFVSQSDEVSEGDTVITSGLGGGFPKGLLIGHVTELRGDDLDLFRELQVKPAVQFDKLESVLVISNFIPNNLDQ